MVLRLEDQIDGWTHEQMENFIEENKFPVLHAESIILQISESLTLCSRHSRELQKMLRIQYI